MSFSKAQTWLGLIKNNTQILLQSIQGIQHAEIVPRILLASIHFLSLLASPTDISWSSFIIDLLVLFVKQKLIPVLFGSNT